MGIFICDDHPFPIFEKSLHTYFQLYLTSVGCPRFTELVLLNIMDVLTRKLLNSHNQNEQDKKYPKEARYKATYTGTIVSPAIN